VSAQRQPHPRGRRPSLLFWLLGLVLATTYPADGRAQGVAALSALKAAYTFHFINLTRWDPPGERLEFCVGGDSEAGDRMLSTLQDKSVHGQTIRVRRLGPDADGRERCDALFIPESEGAHAAELLERYKNTATLTISDAPGFVKKGGIIGFVIVEDRLRFDINERAASKKRLKISAKLLELARDIVR
jgi:hypothetical protein